MMKKLFAAFAVVCMATMSFAQIEGKWKTIDDATGKAKSIVEIYKKSDGKYYGRVLQLLIADKNLKCTACKDDRKNKPVVGMDVIRGLTKDGNEFDGGTIVDPKDGKVYKCLVTRDGNKLNVRGYVGISAIGRTQVWHKVN